MNLNWLGYGLLLGAAAAMAGCSDDSDDDNPQPMEMGTDPEDAPRTEVDRFSEDAAMLMVRTEDNGLPGPGEAIDFDQPPFITQGLSPDGEQVRYYNFDVKPRESAPIFVLFHDGEDAPVEGQLNIIDVIPGDPGYNDFWHVHKVTVPADYVANTITNVGDLMGEDFDIERTNIIVNCPVVPDGSTADLRGGGESKDLVMGWFEDEIIYYFEFSEKMLSVSPPADGHPMVPLSPIYVSFNINPDEEGGGPASGFMTEEDSMQTHNVLATLPDDPGYSPLWTVNVYNNEDFDSVTDLDSAMDADELGSGVATVNCPVVDF